MMINPWVLYILWSTTVTADDIETGMRRGCTNLTLKEFIPVHRAKYTKKPFVLAHSRASFLSLRCAKFQAVKHEKEARPYPLDVTALLPKVLARALLKWGNKGLEEWPFWR